MPSFAWLIMALIATSHSSALASDQPLGVQLDALLKTYANRGTTYVARVIDASNSREFFAHDIDRAVAPASNAKLANLAAGLDRFGPEYHWRTYLAVDNNDLWLIGTGDPSCGDRRIESKHGQPRLAILDEFVNAVLDHHVSEIAGDLIVDDGYFDDERSHPTWPKSELTEYWAAPISGLALNDNCIVVTAFPDHFDVLPHTRTLRIINQLRAGPTSEPTMTRDANANTFTITGTLDKKTELDWKAVTDPGLFFADALRTRMAEMGITVRGQIRRASRNAADAKWKLLKDEDQRDPRILAVHETLLPDVLSRIGKESQNLFADALCKLQGQAWDREHGRDVPGSWRAGSDAVHDFLRRQKIDDSQYALIDGSGLSPDNRVTARLISDLLLTMQKHPHNDIFRASLSIAGVDGTLDDRMMDLKGQVIGKSGAIDGVKALSGYLTTRTGQPLIFVMIFNNIPEGLSHDCQHLLDSACRLMVENAKPEATW